MVHNFKLALLENCKNNVRNSDYVLALLTIYKKARNEGENTDLKNVLDGLIDITIFAYGALFKLGYTDATNKYFQRVAAWNKARNLLNFDAKNEFTFICEEFFELSCQNHQKSKEFARALLKDAPNNLFADWQTFYITLTKEAISAAEKLIAENKETFKKSFADYFEMVMQANDLKGKKVDEHGKIIKSDDFKAPENKF